MAPSDFHRRLRLCAARRMIARGRPIAEAADAAGFADRAHLPAVPSLLGQHPGHLSRDPTTGSTDPGRRPDRPAPRGFRVDIR
ncbi:hypothetical protein [Nocardia pseudobrasiliensis]|uniref:hypothetical protein n=1 Tax=Nocardia pseudobrasiliensis TaxID=45979 RepID=UPI001B88201A